MAKVSREIVLNQIRQTISERNTGRHHGTKYLFHQIFNFHYSDGAKMLTVGGVLLDEGQTALFEGSSLKGLFYVRTGDEPFRIEVPNLTRTRDSLPQFDAALRRSFGDRPARRDHGRPRKVCQPIQILPFLH